MYPLPPSFSFLDGTLYPLLLSEVMSSYIQVPLHVYKEIGQHNMVLISLGAGLREYKSL